MRRLPSLDGVRAISIVLVLLGHVLHFSVAESIGDLANLGVRCFFVLSGFLITTLLLQEHDESGRISLSSFYARRTLRIFPAAYVFMVAMFALQKSGAIAPIDPASWLHALTYTTDYQPLAHRAWNLGHLWSLAVEEQFYLVWPITLVLLRPKRGIHAAVAVMLLVPVIRLMTWRFFPSNAANIKWQFHTVCDALATGCVLAGYRDALWRRPLYRRFLESRAVVLVPALILVLNREIVGRLRFNYSIGQTLLNVGIAVCLDRVVRFPAGWSGKILNLRPVAYLGTLSYSLYLWQQPFFNPEVRSWIALLPANVLCPLALAFLSYTFIERPFLKLRHRFAWKTRPLEAPAAPPVG